MTAASRFTYDVHDDQAASEFFAAMLLSGVQPERVEAMQATRRGFLATGLCPGMTVRVLPDPVAAPTHLVGRRGIVLGLERGDLIARVEFRHDRGTTVYHLPPSVVEEVEP